MKPATVWLNKHLSNTWEIFALLQESRRAEEFRIICTHPQPRYPGHRYCETFEQEPIGLGGDAYVNYCLDFARRHEVNFFWPGRKLLPIVRARARFADLGVRVLAAADLPGLTALASKARVYASLKDAGFSLPDYEVVTDVAGFDAAYARLRVRHSVICYKPAVSVYGLGFHIIADDGPKKDPWHIRLEDARRKLANDRRGRDLMVMEYLPGPERSVDCLAQDGVLLRCVVRRKEQEGQVIEDNPEIVEVVRRLTAHFRLTHLFNVQFRDAGGTCYLLEINPRMSGGLPFACQSGLTLPYWALRLALGTATPKDIPQPRAGIFVPQPAPVSSL